MIFFFISLSTYFCYLILKYRKGLKALQENKFKVKDFGKWIFKNAKKTLFIPELFAVGIIAISIYTDAKITGIFMVVFYMLLFLYELKIKDGNIKLESKGKRVVITACLIYLLVFIALCWIDIILQNKILFFDYKWIFYLIVIVMSYLSYFVILISAIINKPLEHLLKKKKGKA